jgi:hypothetical protein
MYLLWRWIKKLEHPPPKTLVCDKLEIHPLRRGTLLLQNFHSDFTHSCEGLLCPPPEGGNFGGIVYLDFRGRTEFKQVTLP